MLWRVAAEAKTPRPRGRPGRTFGKGVAAFVSGTGQWPPGLHKGVREMSGEVVELRPGYPATVAIHAGEGFGVGGWVVFIAHGEKHRSVWCGTFERYGDALDVAISRSEALGGVRIVDFQAADDDQPVGEDQMHGPDDRVGGAAVSFLEPWRLGTLAEDREPPRGGYAMIAADYPVEPQEPDGAA